MSSGSPPAGDQRESSSRESGTAWHPAREWLDQDYGDDDQDLDYEPWGEMDDGMDEEITSEQAEAEYQAYLDITGDSDERLRNIDIEFTLDDDPEGEEDQEEGPVQRVSAARIVNVMSYHGLRPFFRHGRISDDVDDGSGYASRRPRREQFPKVPNEAGRELMGSGDFGNNSHYVDELKKRKKALATRLMWRELGIDVNGPRTRPTQSISQDLIPRSVADKIIHYDSRCYSGQFSDDGNFFYSCAQNFKVRLYDTSNPHEWKYYKTVEYPFGQWTITDCTLSPDNRFLAYTSIRNLVCLAPTDPAVQSDPTILNLSVPPGERSEEEPYGGSHFAIWSVRFSGDGREIVAGTSQKTVIVYDIETRQSVLRVDNHEDDVNAVCFGDNSSPHILYSGSDDTTIRVWDRRSMGDSREAGVFMGHTEGLTYVDSKGDGRYVLSNSKDQTMKLWDLRKMMTTAKFDTIDVNNYTTGFDYRFETYPDDYYEPHPHDCSVVTFRGHRILKTLIRCHFSPPGSTNSRYVYSGSDDGKVYVYNLDATLAGTIDVGMATLNSRPREPDLLMNAYDFGLRSGQLLWRTCVRDASWHPSAPILAATSWNGWGLSTGTCTLHSWNDCPTEDEGNPPVGLSYDARLEEEPDFNDYRQTMQAFQRGGPLPRTMPRYISSNEEEDENEDEESE